MAKQKKKYEIEVHAGLLVLVLIFLGLNFISNLIIYNTRNIKREETTVALYTAATSIGRIIKHDGGLVLKKDQTEKLCKDYELSGLTLVPIAPADQSEESKKVWLHSVINKLPLGQVPEIAKKILISEKNTITRGEKNEYFLVYPVVAEKEKKLLILSRNLPDLAYLETAAKNQIYFSVLALLMSVFTYIYLYRNILAPFKRLKQDAEAAGRASQTGFNEVESVVAEYQKIIKELREKEAELLIHNESIQRKADSLEYFNQHLLESMFAGVITINNDGKILSVNKAVEETFGISAVEYISKEYHDLPFLPDGYVKLIEETLVDNKFHPYTECEINIDDGRKMTIGITVSPILEDNTSRIGASILINDLTEIRDLQKEVEQNSRMVAMGEMSAGLAHQLRNSLGAIVGFNTLLKKRLGKTDDSRCTVESMESELKEAETLISKFLSFTKAFDYHPQKENLVEIINDVLETMVVRADSQLIEFDWKHPEKTEFWVDLDQILFKQALVNILENSKNAYDNQRGKICISLSSNQNKFSLLIEDFGCGIDENDLQKIFTPFYSSRPSGTGLGLPLAQKIIALHNGSIQVKSRVGEGTMFEITLPEYTEKQVPVG